MLVGVIRVFCPGILRTGHPLRGQTVRVAVLPPLTPITPNDGFTGTAQHQLAAWVVEDLATEVAELRARGVEFEEYDEPGLRTVDGIAVTPVGKAAWFKDSEGNVLTITQLG